MSRNKKYYIYIATNWRNNVIYIGVTNDLTKRIYEHKQKIFKGFTQKYNINKLVYFEEYSEISDAITREKELKKWYVENRWLPAINNVREQYEFERWDFIEVANDIRYIKNQLVDKIGSL